MGSHKDEDGTGTGLALPRSMLKPGGLEGLCQARILVCDLGPFRCGHLCIRADILLWDSLEHENVVDGRIVGGGLGVFWGHWRWVRTGVRHDCNIRYPAPRGCADRGQGQEQAVLAIRKVPSYISSLDSFRRHQARAGEGGADSLVSDGSRVGATFARSLILHASHSGRWISISFPATISSSSSSSSCLHHRQHSRQAYQKRLRKSLQRK